MTSFVYVLTYVSTHLLTNLPTYQPTHARTPRTHDTHARTHVYYLTNIVAEGSSRIFHFQKHWRYCEFWLTVQLIR